MVVAHRLTVTTAILMIAVGATSCGHKLRPPGPGSPRSSLPVSGEPAGPPRAVAEERRRESLRDDALRRSAERAVRGYYSALERKDFTAAWSQLSAAARQQVGGRAAWRRGVENNVSQSASAHARQVAPSRATVAVTLKRTDFDACGRSVTRRFSGTWELVRESGRWLASSVSLAKVAGGTPITRPSACPGTSPVDPPHPRTPVPPTPKPQIEHRHHDDDDGAIPSEHPETETNPASPEGD